MVFTQYQKTIKVLITIKIVKCIHIITFLYIWYLDYQSSNNKYAAEEKAVVEDEIVKTVTERRMEIEQRLNGEPVVIDKKHEPFARGDDAIQLISKPTDESAVEPIEPTEASFEHKRMSFERGVSIEQVLQEDIPVKDKSVEDKKMPSIDEKSIDIDVDMDATSLTFHEKRLSFEQGIPVKEIIQKKAEETVAVPGNGKESTTTIIETEIKSVVKRDTTSKEGDIIVQNRFFYFIMIYNWIQI